jgi:general nucleoside transport system ATP-binding protein
MGPAVRFRDVHKRFGAVVANHGISFDIAAGSIHGIVGENGAGKSTLMSILYGFYRADGGQIEVDGLPLELRHSEDAIAAGIGMVHQHFMLVDTFTVLENVVLGAERGALLKHSLEHATGVLRTLADDYQLRVPLDVRCGELSVGAQQRVEILKALYRGARILILDEPTGVLTPQEADQLFRVLRTLAGQGVTIVLITHKLREILAVTDVVTVMRAGAVVSTLVTRDTDAAALAEMMVGRKVALTVKREERRPGTVALRTASLATASAAGAVALKDISFELRAGEILGVAGVAGNGQSELLEVLAGMSKPASGRVFIDAHEISPRSSQDAFAMRRLGIAHVPEDRLRTGLVSAFSAAQSAILGNHRDSCFDGPAGLRWFWSMAAIRAHCQACFSAFDVRPSDPELRTGGFSGGNQQKLLLAREIATAPKILLVGQPTRGVDIGAIELIHKRLLALRDAGTAILLVSVELDEILALSDRIMVMYEGQVAGLVDAGDADERTIGLMMANALADRVAAEQVA